MPYLEETYDMCGCGSRARDAGSLSCARLGLETIMFTVSVDSHRADALQSQRGQGSKGDIWSGVGRAGRGDGQKHRQDVHPVKNAQ